MLKQSGDIIAAGFFILLALGVFIASSFIEIKDNYGGAALVPRICAGIVLLAAGWELAGGLRRRKQGEPVRQEGAGSDEETAAEDRIPSDYKKVLLTFGSIILYVILFQLIGFMPATFLYITSQTLLLAPKEERKVIPALIIVAVFSGAIYLIFTRVFWIMLPTGTLW